MATRGLDPNLSGLLHTGGLQDRDTVACVAGNSCSRMSRVTGFAALQTQANSGNPTNFQTKLEQIIPKDCFECSKHQERHTKHVHCTMEAGGNSGISVGPYFEGCKAGVDLEALANTIKTEIGNVISNLTGLVPQTSAVGGPSIATNYSTVDFAEPESCDNPDDRSSPIHTSSRRFENNSFLWTFTKWSLFQGLYWIKVPPRILAKGYKPIR
jgi:hypothetical protein